MKLNIEELAQAAWLSAEGPKIKEYCIGNATVPMIDMRDELIKELTPALTAFAKEIVERCAQEPDDLAGHLLAFHDRKGAAIAISIKNSIRNLVED